MTNLFLSNKEDLKEAFREVVHSMMEEMQHNNSKLTNRHQESELMSRKEAAAYLKITLVTLNTWTRQGIIECKRINSRVYYLRSSLKQVLK